MKNFTIDFSGLPVAYLPDGLDVGVLGEHNAVQIVILLPDSMITGMDYHTVTVGDVESALITDTEANVDGAYRVGNTIYQPLTAAYTTQKFVSVFVTAYKQTDAVPEIVDKTPTVHGLHFSGGVPRPIPGGIAAQIAELQRKVDELDGAGVKVVQTLPDDPKDNDIVYLEHNGFFWYAGEWVQLTDDGAGLDELSETVEAMRQSIPTQEQVTRWNDAAAVVLPIDDVTLLALEAYDALSLRDDFTGIGTLDDVPIYVLDSVSYGFGLYEDEADPSNCDCVSVGEVWDDDTGLPVRFVRAVRSGTGYTRWSRDCTVDGHVFLRGVWYTNNTATDAPSFAGFTPTVLEVCGDWYDDLSDLPEKAASALRSLSQLVNVSAAAMGTIRVPENAVQRFAGSLKDGMHFSYTAHDDMTLDFPTLPWTDAVSVIVLDLHCLQNIELTLPREKLLDGGSLPNTTAGEHTLTFTYVPAAGKWSVGCVNRVQPQYWDDIPDTVIPLDDCTWTQIKSIAEHGYLNRAGQWCIRRNNEEEVWFEIGDEKTVALSGGETWTVQIWDFNHDDLADGSGKAPFTFGMKDVTAGTYRINSINTANGGWEACTFRMQTVGVIMQTLPEELQNIIAEVIKNTCISQTKNTEASRIYSNTTDALFLPTWAELGGSSATGTDGGSRYAFFSDNASRASTAQYGLRSLNFVPVSGYAPWSACRSNGTLGNITDTTSLNNMRLAFCV